MPPYTLREALHGTAHLHSPPPHTPPNNELRRNLKLFTPIFDRPKQAIHHLLELFILHICHLTPSDKNWHQNLLTYLAAASQHLIPPTQPQTLPNREHYPPIPVRTADILHLLRTYTSSFTAPPLTPETLSEYVIPQNQPAKSAILVYMTYLAHLSIPNAWLKPLLHDSTGQRERNKLPDMPLITLFTPPYVDRNNQLMWYTVRSAAPGEVITLPATAYARGNHVTVHAGGKLERAVRVAEWQICNLPRLDMRLWLVWTNGMRGVGPYASLGRGGVGRVRFDSPVLWKDAVAVGFREGGGGVVRPDGKKVGVRKRGDGLFEVGRGRGGFEWSWDMKFA